MKPQKHSAQPLSVQYKPTRLTMTIQIPTLDAVSDIFSVPFTDGVYPVEWLERFVGMLDGSSLRGAGLTILTGRNHLNTTEAGLFMLLNRLEPGDSIMITDERGVMQIRHVYKSVKIPAGGFSNVAAEVKENALILLTCEDESAGGGYLTSILLHHKYQIIFYG